MTSTNEDNVTNRTSVHGQTEDTSSNLSSSGNNAIYDTNTFHQSVDDVSHVKDAVSLRGAISVASVKEMAATHSSVTKDEKVTAPNLYMSSPSQESITKIVDLAGSSGSHQQVANVESEGDTKDRKRWSWG